MKKVVILFVAVMLALPAISYAGSATSRWDLTIGGMVKLDYFYADQTSNQDITYSEREGATPGTVTSRKRASESWGVGETRLNFLVKGPDTWGAKTSAFVEFDFRSASSNSVSATTRNSAEDYGLANLRHAFMKFDWPSFSIVAGRTWSVPGNQPCFCLLGVNENGASNKGAILEEVYASWQATKTFSITGGIMTPYNTTKNPGGTIGNSMIEDNGFQESLLPLFFTEFLYKTDACGKIGPWMLQFGLGGIYGQEKPSEPADLTQVGNQTTQGGASGTGLNTVSNPNISGVVYQSVNGYDSSRVNMWMATFKTYIPIIPEKAPGKLAHSLGLAFAAFTGQNVRSFAGAPPFTAATFSYNRALYRTPTGTTNVGTPTANTQLMNPHANFVAPVDTGGWGQLQWYWTDTLWTGVYYAENHISLSGPRSATISPGAIDYQKEWHVNLIYDPNPAIRLGIEYSWYQTHYARNQYATGTLVLNPAAATASQTTLVNGGLTSGGTANSLRLSAQYFF